MSAISLPDTFHSDLGNAIHTDFTRDDALVTTIAVHPAQGNILGPANHAQTLRATRNRKLPGTASDAVIAAAVPERTKHIHANAITLKS